MKKTVKYLAALAAAALLGAPSAGAADCLFTCEYGRAMTYA